MNTIELSSRPFDWFIGPLLKFNQMLVGQTVRLHAIQMYSVQGYFDLAAAQTLAGARVSNPDSLHTFVDTQLAAISFANYRVIDDSHALAKWGYEYCAQSNSLARQHALEILFGQTPKQTKKQTK